MTLQNCMRNVCSQFSVPIPRSSRFPQSYLEYYVIAYEIGYDLIFKIPYVLIAQGHCMSYSTYIRVAVETVSLNKQRIAWIGFTLSRCQNVLRKMYFLRSKCISFFSRQTVSSSTQCRIRKGKIHERSQLDKMRPSTWL